MDLIEAIVIIGNHDRVKKVCEPQVMQSLELKSWMVKRTLYAWRLLEDELRKDTGGTVSEVNIPIERAVHGDS